MSFISSDKRDNTIIGGTASFKLNAFHFCGSFSSMHFISVGHLVKGQKLFLVFRKSESAMSTSRCRAPQTT